MNTSITNIAFVSDDGTTISAHFGRAKYYEVLHVENGVVRQRERREKPGHHVPHEHHDHGKDNGRHGFDPVSREKHTGMLAPIADCQIVVARGMGAGAYQHITEARITPILTELKTIDEALQAILGGTIVNHTERLH